MSVPNGRDGTNRARTGFGAPRRCSSPQHFIVFHEDRFLARTAVTGLGDYCQTARASKVALTRRALADNRQLSKG